MYKIYTPIIAILITSCTTKIRYIGQSHPPTKTIDIFVTERSIKQPYEYIGKGYLRGYVFHRNPEKILEIARKKGLEKGADAVIITDYYIPDTGGTNISSIYKTDTVGRGTVTVGSTLISPTTSSGYNILYLKYSK